MIGIYQTQRSQGFPQKPHQSVRARQVRGKHSQPLANLPKWRRPLVGYICALPILLLALFIPMLLQQFMHPLIFPVVFMTLALTLIAFLWGIGPALFALVMSLIGLDFYFIPPMGQFSLLNWWDMAQLVPFVFSSLILVLLTGQRERAYRKLQTVAQELEGYASELEGYASELEAAKSHLEEENREKEGFLSIASHELKNPVATIRGYSQLLRRRLAKRSTLTVLPDLEPACKRLEEQTVRLTILID